MIIGRVAHAARYPWSHFCGQRFLTIGDLNDQQRQSQNL